MPRHTGKAITVAMRTSNAYSVNNYASWVACASMLLRRGYTAAQAEAILRSKWMRWSCDASNKRYGTNTSVDLARFLDDKRNGCTLNAVRDLVRS